MKAKRPDCFRHPASLLDESVDAFNGVTERAEGREVRIAAKTRQADAWHAKNPTGIDPRRKRRTMTRSAPDALSQPMLALLHDLNDPASRIAASIHAPPVTARALVRRGLAYRDSNRRLTITEVGRAAMEAARERAA